MLATIQRVRGHTLLNILPVRVGLLNSPLVCKTIYVWPYAWLTPDLFTDIKPDVDSSTYVLFRLISAISSTVPTFSVIAILMILCPIFHFLYYHGSLCHTFFVVFGIWFWNSNPPNDLAYVLIQISFPDLNPRLVCRDAKGIEPWDRLIFSSSFWKLPSLLLLVPWSYWCWLGCCTDVSSRQSSTDALPLFPAGLAPWLPVTAMKFCGVKPDARKLEYFQGARAWGGWLGNGFQIKHDMYMICVIIHTQKSKEKTMN